MPRLTGLEVAILVWVLICIIAVKVLVSLSICSGFSESLLFLDVISTKNIHAGSFLHKNV